MYSSRHHRSHILVALLVALTLLPGCSSRYRLDLYQTIDEERRKVKVEKTQFVRDAQLAAPSAEEQIVPGSSNVVILTTGTRGPQRETSMYEVLSYDQYLRCNVYLQLPQAMTADTLLLKESSFLRLLGQYELSPEERLFMPDSGTCVIDSVAGGRLYATLAGLYKNGKGMPLAVDGKFRVKISD